ncbi:hypothetical protein [Chryseobacterium sp. G0201]|uniref:hypothetical protein n=1 Tax=Chryseobacterium sp. G0201 TaxID=2487065 RepID=UPI000F513930|nr:hypothetical protein [Chryseobacterium sp. G0201]AZA55187.1 hypothetical protein EG348_20390 [Chryseobacterium sp. G0201]
MIHITNTIRFNQSFDDFTRNPKNRYRTFGIEDDVVPKRILKRIGKKEFKDEPLTKEESLELKQHLENKIKELVSTRVPEPDVRTKIDFLGEIIGINFTPFGKNHQDNWISMFFSAYKICEECLEEHKPLYLSISEHD